ncbi:MAG TPA: PDZ domain-containing protein, partial [Steroidobacteraceae bacterium]
KQVFLEPHAGTATRESYDRSGMWLIATDGGLKVVDVLPGGPAFHAGIRVADHIIAVDGHPAKEVALAALRARFRAEPAGTRIVLRLLSGRAPRQVHLTLADIV